MTRRRRLLLNHPDPKHNQCATRSIARCTQYALKVGNPRRPVLLASSAHWAMMGVAYFRCKGNASNVLGVNAETKRDSLKNRLMVDSVPLILFNTHGQLPANGSRAVDENPHDNTAKVIESWKKMFDLGPSKTCRGC